MSFNNLIMIGFAGFWKKKKTKTIQELKQPQIEIPIEIPIEIKIETPKKIKGETIIMETISAYKTQDGNIFEDKAEATSHEKILIFKKDISTFVTRHASYSSAQEFAEIIFDNAIELYNIIQDKYESSPEDSLPVIEKPADAKYTVLESEKIPRVVPQENTLREPTEDEKSTLNRIPAKSSLFEHFTKKG